MSGQASMQLHAIVHGHVQGVSFRFYTLQRAQRLQLTGWVRNCADRSVEVCAEGPHAQLEHLLTFLHEGPPSAQVIRVDFEWLDATNRFDSFTVHYGLQD